MFRVQGQGLGFCLHCKRATGLGSRVQGLGVCFPGERCSKCHRSACISSSVLHAPRAMVLCNRPHWFYAGCQQLVVFVLQRGVAGVLCVRTKGRDATGGEAGKRYDKQVSHVCVWGGGGAARLSAFFHSRRNACCMLYLVSLFCSLFVLSLHTGAASTWLIKQHRRNQCTMCGYVL